MNLPLPPVAGVIGWPIAQSKSPLIHRFWLRELDIDGDYSRFPIAPDAVGAAMRALAPLGLRGVNVTAPHKLAVMEYLDGIDPAAKALGAVNTVVVAPDGRLHGHNTDVAGFLAPLARADLRGKPVTILGAGGAARAVLAAMAHVGAGPVTLLARNPDLAAKLLAASGVNGIARPFDAAIDSDCALLVQATSLGMTGKPPLAIDIAPLPAHAIVYDLVYAPLETDLLAAARRGGLRTIDGLHMLIGQAALAFRHFYQAEPPRDRDSALRALLVG